MLEIVIPVVILLGIALYFVSIYNNFVTLRNEIDKTWSNINVLLKQRFDEIPNLVNTVKGYMKHEKDTLTAITEARSAWSKAKSIPEKAHAEGMLNGALKTMFAVAENYPTLKANDNFMQLQGRISTLETDIAGRRETYNDSVNTFNIKIAQFPDNIVAGMMSLKARELFQVSETEKKTPKVEF
ncbi:LemA family protein [Candidatus Tiddalikarchaeum anstoanum]|nr:LemA family protein [Candidatus Tiddalikarchaeum anstoanum]